MIIEDSNGNIYRRPDWIDLVGTLGPLTPTIAYIASDGAIYGSGGRLLAAGRPERQLPRQAREGEAREADAHTRDAAVRQLARITAARSSLSNPRRHGDRPGADRRATNCR